jgi:hypothetical protein
MNLRVSLVIYKQDFPMDALFAQLEIYLRSGWNIIVTIGSFASAILIALGLIYWFSGYEEHKGRKMVMGGVILFIAMQWLAFNPPWQYFLI